MNTANDLVIACRQRGIVMVAEGETLRAEGPDEALTEELLSKLKDHKPELLAELRRTDPMVMSLATPNGPCQVTIPRKHYDSEAFTAFADRLALIPPTTETDPRRWRGAEITAPDMRTITVTTTDGWGQVYWRQLARAYFPRGHVVHALDPVELEDRRNIDAEAEDLREHFQGRAGILEYDAGLPRADAELEAARITATYARNAGYSWASLRSALSAYPELLASLPEKAGSVDSLPLGAAKVAVRGKCVVRQGAFVGAHEVTP